MGQFSYEVFVNVASQFNIMYMLTNYDFKNRRYWSPTLKHPVLDETVNMSRHLYRLGRGTQGPSSPLDVYIGRRRPTLTIVLTKHERSFRRRGFFHFTLK